MDTCARPDRTGGNEEMFGHSVLEFPLLAPFEPTHVPRSDRSGVVQIPSKSAVWFGHGEFGIGISVELGPESRKPVSPALLRFKS